MDNRSKLHEEGAHKRRGSDSRTSTCASPPKKQKSGLAACFGSANVVDISTPKSEKLASSWDANRGLNYAMRQIPDHDASDFRSLKIHARHPQYCPPQMDQSSSFSPSSTPSPLFSQTSSSTMASNLCVTPEDMQIPPCHFANKSPFLGQETKSLQPPADSSVCTESSTSLELFDVPSTSHEAEDSADCQVEPETIPHNMRSILTTKSKEAEQALFVNEDPALPISKEAYINQQPTKFSDLDQDVQCQIFGHALVRQSPYYPYYRCGMLADGPWSPGYIDGVIDCNVVDFENSNLSLLQVNKYFNKTCSEIFYGANFFVFYKADICSWWIRHIGLKNFSHIRSLALALGSGFRPNRDGERCPFELSQEEMWFGVLHWMKNRHLLRNLHIEIRQWQDLRQSRSLTLKEQTELYQFRRAISDLLKRFRGIQSVKVSSFESTWFSPREQHRFSLLMQQQRRKVVRKAKEPSLLQLINRIRLEREEEEQEGLRQRRHRRVQLGYY